MTPEEFNKIHTKSGMDLYELADLLGVGDRNVRRYKLGQIPISGPVTRLMTLLSLGRIGMADIRSVV